MIDNPIENHDKRIEILEGKVENQYKRIEKLELKPDWASAFTIAVALLAVLTLFCFTIWRFTS